MNKLEVGMWVKTKFGEIGKIEKYCGTNSCGDLWKLDIKENAYNYKNIINYSFNIIDLIEVGDYVNGEKVVAIHEHYVWDEQDIGTAIETEHEYTAILNEDIKSIVTKEQFESMEYEVK